MKNRYRVFRRAWGTYYCEDLLSKRQESLKTRNKDEAYRLVAAKNETEALPAFSLHLARVYWKAGDPAAAKRSSQHVMDEIPKLKKGVTKIRWLTAVKDKAMDSIRDRVVLETQAEHFLKVLENGSISTNIYLRRVHNFALDMSWLPWPVLPKNRRAGHQVQGEARRHAGGTSGHRRSRTGIPNAGQFYQPCMALGRVCNRDVAAFLERVRMWICKNNVISFARKKNNSGSIAIMRFDDDVAEILQDCRPVKAARCSRVFTDRARWRPLDGISFSLRWPQNQRRFTALAIGMRGRRGRKPQGIRNGSHRKRWATIARRCIVLTPEKPNCNCRRWANTNVNGRCLPTARRISRRSVSCGNLSRASTDFHQRCVGLGITALPTRGR